MTSRSRRSDPPEGTAPARAGARGGCDAFCPLAEIESRLLDDLEQAMAASRRSRAADPAQSAGRRKARSSALARLAGQVAAAMPLVRGMCV